MLSDVRLSLFVFFNRTKLHHLITWWKKCNTPARVSLMTRGRNTMVRAFKGLKWGAFSGGVNTVWVGISFKKSSLPIHCSQHWEEKCSKATQNKVERSATNDPLLLAKTNGLVLLPTPLFPVQSSLMNGLHSILIPSPTANYFIPFCPVFLNPPNSNANRSADG